MRLDVSDVLKRLSFETFVGRDLDEDGMKDKSISFVVPPGMKQITEFVRAGR
jgi:hypothetical protein